MQRTYRFRDGKELTLGGRTLVMGILNVTPDSFSDGGRWNTRDSALRHMEEMVRDGASSLPEPGDVRLNVGYWFWGGSAVCLGCSLK